MNTLIYVGEDIENPLFVFNEDEIMSVNIDSSVDLLQKEMKVDTAEIVVYYDDELEELRKLAWKTPVYIYSGSDLIGRFYSTGVKRISEKQYEISTVSYIGFLDNEIFYGGVYDNVLLPDVIETLVRTDGLRTLNVLESLKINRPDSEGKMGAPDKTVHSGGYYPNDMRDAMHVKFRFNGFHNDQYTTTGTAWSSAMVGTVARDSASSDYKSKQYGVIGVFTRASESDLYGTTELFFRYRTQSISIGTPNIGDIIEIDCSPLDGVVTINGTSYSITAPSTEVLNSNYYVGGGVLIDNSAHPDDHHTNLEFLEYTIQNYRTGDNLIDLLPLLDLRTKKVYWRNGTNGGQAEVPCSDPNTAVAIAGDAPGTFPLNYRKDFVDSITYAPEALNYRISGWVPICTKREALHQILLSSGLSLKKSSSGDWLIGDTSSRIAGAIAPERMFDGGSVEYSGDVKEIILKEHNYIDTSASVAESIFSASEASSDPFVAEFTKKPSKITTYLFIEDGQPYNGETYIYNWCENAALIPGVLTEIQGYPYNHQEKVYTEQTEVASGTTVSVENVTTITKDNSDRMFQRLKNYYIKSHTCKFDIIKNGERCAQKFSFTNPFNEEDSGYLVKCAEKLSSFSKAQCEFLCGFDPVPLDNDYTHYVILTGTGTWNVPEEVLTSADPRIRVVLISGGTGGYSGCAGENGQTVSAGSFPSQAKGGEAGNPGSGGKILDFVIHNPAQTYTYSSGIGGAGAPTNTNAATHIVGSQGTASTISDGLTTHTSEDGQVVEAGHVNFLTGDRYASSFKLPGWKEIRRTETGTRFGYGGLGGWFTDNTKYDYFMYSAFGCYLMRMSDDFDENQWGVNYWGGGFFGNPYPSNAGFQEKFQKGGGCGGGAGIGEDGANGSAASSSKAGNGGRGGNAIWIPPKATDYNPIYYGYGGHGGGGGGGGGASGYLASGTRGTGGTGGYGGRGGDGGDGCVLIYY